MSSYRQALKTARTEYIRKLIDNHQNNPRFLFSTVARLTNKQMSPDLNIPSQFNSNDFMNFFTDKIDNIRNTITNVDSTASSTSASFIAPKEKLLDPWNRWTTYTLTLLQLEQTTDSSGRRGTGPPTEPGFSQGFFSILSPMEFWFLAAVASGLLSWGHFISSTIIDLIAQIL